MAGVSVAAALPQSFGDGDTRMAEEDRTGDLRQLREAADDIPGD